jgi:glycyl-tRNA synthetase (class II)
LFVADKGSYDLEAHIGTTRNRKKIQSCHNTPKVIELFIKNATTEEWVIETE